MTDFVLVIRGSKFYSFIGKKDEHSKFVTTADAAIHQTRTPLLSASVADPGYKVGDLVEGKVELYNGSTRWFPGQVIKIYEHNQNYDEKEMRSLAVDVQYSDGEIHINKSILQIRHRRMLHRGAGNASSSNRGILEPQHSGSSNGITTISGLTLTTSTLTMLSPIAAGANEDEKFREEQAESDHPRLCKESLLPLLSNSSNAEEYVSAYSSGMSLTTTLLLLLMLL